MSDPQSSPESSWAFVGISPEARKAAELAAEEADMDVDLWLAQLIKYRSAMELRGKETGSLDSVIMQIASPADAEATDAASEPAAVPGVNAVPPVSEPGPAPGMAPTTVSSETSSAAPTETTGSETLRVGNVTPISAPATTPATTPRPDANRETAPDTASTMPSKPTAASQAPQASNGEAAKAEEKRFPGVDPMTAPRPTVTADGPPPRSGTVDDVAAAVLRPTTPPARRTTRPEAVANTAPAKVTPNKTTTGVEVVVAPRMMPTEALRPTRLSALSRSSEEEIQAALDGWRDSRAIEPLVVRPAPEQRNMYEIIVGVARWHAARRAHVRELPITIREVSDEEAIRIAMSARLNRGGASPLMEAEIYMSLMSEAQMSTEQVARMVGKPPAHIATVVRVLNLPKSVRDMLDRGEITALHARALLESHNPDAIAREIIARRLDIYQTEQLVRTAAQHAGDVEKVSLEAVDLDIADPNSLPNSSPESNGDTKSDGSKADVASTSASVSREDVSDEPAFPARDIGKLSQEKFEPADDVIAFEDEDIAILEDAAKPEANVTILPDPANDVSKTVTVSEVAKADDETKSEVAVPNTKSSSDGGEVVTTELLERHLARLLGIKVAITENENVGAMTLHYSGREQLSDIVARLNSLPKR